MEPKEFFFSFCLSGFVSVVVVYCEGATVDSRDGALQVFATARGVCGSGGGSGDGIAFGVSRRRCAVVLIWAAVMQAL